MPSEVIPYFRDYLTQDRDFLLARLADVQWELASLADQLGFMEADELRSRVGQFHNSTAQSVAAKEWEARYEALSASCSMAELKGKIAARTEEKFFLIRLLDASPIIDS